MRCLIATVLLAAVLSGCGGSDEADVVDGIPESWLETTAEQWPASDGFGAGMPVLSSKPCALGDMPEILGERARRADVGYDGAGTDPEAYLYVCDFFDTDSYGLGIRLFQAGSADEAREAAALSDQDTPVQDNEVETVAAGELEMQVLTRWYPTNPHGQYTAVYVDEDAEAYVSMDISIWEKADFDEFSAQLAADALLALMAGA